MTQAGESEELALRLGNIFAYDIDFTRDRGGDAFKLIVDKKFREGSFVGYGQLAAASFTNQGQTYYAYRYGQKREHGLLRRKRPSPAQGIPQIAGCPSLASPRAIP